ncbi:PLD nuclease N-terminal domain-containing protein [Actinoplanes sp. NPDC020271]|uniref:PLD nuclease N-terminal domain-containing protein n=1 Tax=Actinoplanes sp. NPDC020271 TaxID=3363896 RepID=UPI0037A95CFA
MARLNMLLFLVTVALTVVAMIDCLATDRTRVQHFPRNAWLVLIVLCPVAGAVAWFRAGRVGAGERTILSGQTSDWTVAPGRAAPIGPDDDPEFLRLLAEAIRNR